MIALGSTTDFYKICDGFDIIQKAFAGQNLVWEFQVDWNKEYLEFDVVSGGTISWTYYKSLPATPDSRKTIQYSKNNSPWTSVISSTGGTTINVVAGDKIRWRGDNAAYHFEYSESLGHANNFFTGTATYNVYGNIMSLVYKNNFIGATTLSTSYAFSYLFQDGPISCEYLKMPATTLSTWCYSNMFYGSTTLVTAPELPATTLSENCYYMMFWSCTSLTDAPDLPATALTANCYSYMFAHCTSLTTMPAISATTLAQGCFSFMFYECSSLVNAAVSLPVMTLAANCYYNMFNGCSSLVTAPTLPATTLAANCYKEMFFNCTGLTYVQQSLPATTLAANCYESMFQGCSSLEDAPNLPATALAENCYESMFYGCTSLINIPTTLPATTLAPGCYCHMFRDCIEITNSPELPAETLVTDCYRAMFYGCSSLNNIKCYAINISATRCTLGWTAGVASSGVFSKAFENEQWTTGSDGIPTNWTVVNGDDMSSKYLTFNMSSSGTIVWKHTGSTAKTIEYKLNDGNWTSLTSTTGTTALIGGRILDAGDVVKVRGNNSEYSTGSNNYAYFTRGSGSYKVYGNIMSLIYGDNFVGQTTLTSDGAFNNLFRQSNIIDASNLVLPATTLTSACYQNMFYGCNAMSIGPSLSATALTASCYAGMFYGCYSLTTAPTLPATALTASCYSNMFYGCRALITAPTLPATTLASSCYSNMFESCTGLTTAPSLPATALTTACYYQMFRDCTALTTAPTLPATTLATNCYYGMFWGCDHLTTPPALAATNLATSCYAGMFYGCTRLTTAPTLPATTLTASCYSQMFRGCTSLTAAPSLEALTLDSYCYYQMFYGCSSLNYIRMIATDITATAALMSWVYGVAASGTFVKDYTMTSLPTGDDGIPTNWNVVNEGEPTHDYSHDYLTIRSLVNNNTIQYLRSGTGTGIDRQIYYSTNGGTSWTSAYKGMMSVTLNEGDTLLLKGSNNNYADGSKYLYFSSTGNVDLEGNIMSLIYGDNFIGQTTLTANYAFQGMFRTCKVVDASNLILPATTLSNYCYANMFQNVSTLITAPTLPATVLTDYCYYSMFLYCSSLKYVKCLATNISAYWCTYDWMYGVASGGTFVKDSTMTSWPAGGGGIPSSWTVEDA